MSLLERENFKTTLSYLFYLLLIYILCCCIRVYLDEEEEDNFYVYEELFMRIFLTKDVFTLHTRDV